MLQLIILALCVPHAVAEDTASSVTPVQKVIELMNGMVEKGKREKKAEETQFAAYSTFCANTLKEKAEAIATAEDRIEMLRADIRKAGAEADTLGEEIAELETKISQAETDSQKAEMNRELERGSFMRLHTDISESENALTRAIKHVKKQAFDRKQAAKEDEEGEDDEDSFLAISNIKKLGSIPEGSKRAIDAFLAQSAPEGTDVSAPQGDAYEFRSDGILDMFASLRNKFKDQRIDAENKERMAVQAHQMLMLDLTTNIEQMTKSSKEKAAFKAKAKQVKANAEGDLLDTTGTMEEDKKYRADLKATCETKASEFESRQKLRLEEIDAVEKAIQIISGSAVAGAAGKHMPALIQVKQTAFVQMSTGEMSPNQRRLFTFISEKANKLDSHVLSALAVHIASDPLGKVKKMIKELIWKIMEEANQETSHKGWCDKELSSNKFKRVEKSRLSEKLQAEVDELTADIATLTEELTELNADVSELAAAMAKQTEIRQEEKATNTETIKDAKAAQVAISQALDVLKDFYEKAGEATALLQQLGKKAEPEIFDKPYKGMGAESGGVVAMIEVIEEDFARLQAETEAAETQAQAEYDDFMTDSSIDKSIKDKSIEHKSSKKAESENTLSSKSSDLEDTNRELNAALEYFEKLKPSCVDAGNNFEDKVAARKEEIESLQDALRILNGEE